jgi:hypothetical protein
MLAQEFAVTKPSGLRGLILSGALADGALGWAAAAALCVGGCDLTR